MALEGRKPLTAFATVSDRSAASAKDATTSSSVDFAFPTPPAIAGDGGVGGIGTAQQPKQPRKQQAVRHKVPYEKGYSQQDWMRLTRSREDLNGLGGRPLGRKVTLDEVATHNTFEDAWMVLNGKVYNVTRYMRFHPGGVDYLMQGAGKDATRLFNKYHKWVNVDFMMQKCFLGPFDNTPPTVQE